MELEYSVITTRGGQRVLRILHEGDLSAEGAKDLIVRVSPGGEFHGLPFMAVVEKNGHFTSKARKLLVEETKGMAVLGVIVVSSAILKMVVGAMLRLASKEHLGVVEDEEQALKWIDSRITTPLSARP